MSDTAIIGSPPGDVPARGTASGTASMRWAGRTGIAIALVVLSSGAVRFERWRVESDLHRTLDVRAVELDRQLARLALVPRLLADDPRIAAVLVAAPSSTPPARLDRPEETDAAIDGANRLLERARAASGAAFVYLMDATGLTVASSNWRDSLSFVGADYGFRPYFRDAIAGAEASFFAVGATTGEPGYFIARPVFTGDGSAGDAPSIASAPAGVVAAKVSLDALVDAWRAGPYRSLVTDELGVVILSTDPGLLYAPGAPLGTDALDALARDRRYEPARGAALSLPATGADGTARVDGARQSSVSRTLRDEPWTLHLLVPESIVTRRALPLAAALAGLALIALLLARTFRQQRRLADAEQRAARELERLVTRRTGELEAAQRALIAESNFAMLGRMSAAINHEINQPLASLRLDLATLRTLTARPLPPLEDIRDAVVDADRTVRRIGRIVETLRSVARQGTREGARDADAALVPVDLERLVADVVATVLRERPAAIDVLDAHASGGASAPAAGVIVRGNAVLLQQAILNLVHNALDAVLGHRDARVALALETGPGSVAVTVTDDGAGVDPVLEGRLFEPFASASGGGLGLGLALAHQIATDHGGTLGHEPRAGGGSVFRLTVPR